MAAKKDRTVDFICGSFDLTERRKYELKNANGDHLLNLYFKPLTRSVRMRAMEMAGNDESGLKVSTLMLCQTAELEDGSKAFSEGDALKLQRELPENVLNEIEFFLHGMEGNINIESAKKP